MLVTKLDVSLAAILIGSSILAIISQKLFATFVLNDSDPNWTMKLASNLLGYAALFLPCYSAFMFLKGKGLQKKGSREIEDSFLNPLIQSLFIGIKKMEKSSEDGNKSTMSKIEGTNKDTRTVLLRLIFCCVGLQVSYLTWGVLQERIMTKEYQSTSGGETSGHFKDSQFLVFVNRVLGFSIAFLYIKYFDKAKRGKSEPPLLNYSFCSLSNIMSSWFQYEALKFVTFPTQVLVKASKIIPVMLMGRILSKKKYFFHEYLVALLISIGMMLFLMDSGKRKEGMANTTSISGMMLLMAYMASDAFTSNWQKDLFDNYKMSAMQMMCGVNIFSALLTFTSLSTQGTLLPAMTFMLAHPLFAMDSVLLSICSASGQLFIYYTIEHFGPVVFTIIMTLRQAFAIILSCYLYGHSMTSMGVLGISTVFSALALKIHMGRKKKR